MTAVAGYRKVIIFTGNETFVQTSLFAACYINWTVVAVAHLMLLGALLVT